MLPDAEALAAALAEHIEQAVTDAVRERGEAHLVLPGGSSPRLLLMKLRELLLPWQSMHLYLTDERCLPPGHADRNDRMLDELLLPYVDLPPANLHRIPAELGAEAGAQGYAHLLYEVPRFDLVILGMGPDGHTASLFSGRAEFLEDSPVVAVLIPPSRRRNGSPWVWGACFPPGNGSCSRWARKSAPSCGAYDRERPARSRTPGPTSGIWMRRRPPWRQGVSPDPSSSR